MRVLVCGGRHYDDAGKIRRALGMVRAETVITGGAKGADDLAFREAARWRRMA